jgi:hypothetical protein
MLRQLRRRDDPLSAGCERVACRADPTKSYALYLLRIRRPPPVADRDFLEEEPSLAGVRATPEFQEILRSLPAAPPAAP